MNLMDESMFGSPISTNNQNNSASPNLDQSTFFPTADVTFLLDERGSFFLGGDNSLDLDATVDFGSILPPSLLSNTINSKLARTGSKKEKSNFIQPLPDQTVFFDTTINEDDDREELFSSTSSFREVRDSPNKLFQMKHRVVSIASEHFHDKRDNSRITSTVIDSPGMTLMDPLIPLKSSSVVSKSFISPIKSNPKKSSPKKRMEEELIIWEDTPVKSIRRAENTPMKMKAKETVTIGGKVFEAGGDFKRSDSLDLMEKRLESLKSTSSREVGSAGGGMARSRSSIDNSSVIFGSSRLSSSGSLDILNTPLLQRYLPSRLNNSIGPPQLPLSIIIQENTQSTTISDSPTITKDLTTLISASPRKESTSERLEKLRQEREERAKSPEKRVIQGRVLSSIVPIGSSINGIASTEIGGALSKPTTILSKSRLPAATTSKIPPRSVIPSVQSSRISRPTSSKILPPTKLSYSPPPRVLSGRTGLIRPVSMVGSNVIRKPASLSGSTSTLTSKLSSTAGVKRLPVSSSSRSVGARSVGVAERKG